MTAPLLKKLFEDAIEVENLTQAFDKAVELAQEGDVILLSPASASFDQYQNFEQRGLEFIELVNNLKK